VPQSALIVGSAPVPGEHAFYRALLEDRAFVIACDAAAEWCVALGRTPDIAVGDFDSAAPGAPERLAALGVDVRRFSAEKDESDLDLAVAVARSLGCDRVTFTAAYTGRIDHTLASVGSAGSAADLRARVEEPGYSALVLSDGGTSSAVLETTPGALVSVIALEPSTGVTLTGLRYPLDCADVPTLSSLGVSNVALGDRVRVSLASGTLLVIASRSADSILHD
jgi:thiamine pyrophosphokinase